MTSRLQRDQVQPRRRICLDLFADAHFGQRGFLLAELRRGIVASLDIRPPESSELNDLARGDEDRKLPTRH